MRARMLLLFGCLGLLVASIAPALAIGGAVVQTAGYPGHDSAALAESLLRRSFADELKAMEREPGMRPLRVERFYGDHVALLDSGGTKPSLPFGLPELQREAPERGRIVESALPLRVGEGADAGPLDLRIDSVEGGLESRRPLVPVRLPTRIGDGAVLQEGVDAIGIEFADLERPDAKALRTEGESLLYPNAREDLDVILAPRATGLEVLLQLRSDRAPVEQRLELALPDGAELQAAAGGAAEVIRDGELLTGIEAPRAVDAAGEDVPVSMEVDGAALVLRSDLEGARLPVLVDPIAHGYAWDTGAGSALNIEDWVLETSPGGPFQTATSCQSPPAGCYGAPGNDHGLYLYAPPDQNYATGSFARASYTVARFEDDLVQYGSRPTTFIPRGELRSVDYHERTDTADDPTAIASLWGEEAPQTIDQEILSSDVSNFNVPALEGATQADRQRSKRLQLELRQIGAARTPSEWRDAYVGGAVVTLDDLEAPTLPPLEFTNFPTTWVEDAAYSVAGSGTDPGLGMKQFLFAHGRTGAPIEFEFQQHDCTGQPRPTLWCPREWTQTHDFDTAELAEGVNNGNAFAYDLLGKASARSWNLRIDRSTPEVQLSGSLLDQNTPGADLHIAATDGSYDPNASVAANLETARSGVKSIEVLVDGERADYVEQPCPGAEDFWGSCAMDRDWTFSAARWGESEHEVTVIVTDQIGHETSETFRVLDDIITKPGGWMDERAAETTVWAHNPPAGPTTPPNQIGISRITLTLPGGEVITRDFPCNPTGPCEQHRSATFEYDTAGLPEGIQTGVARGYRPDGTEFRTWETDLRIDHSDPEQAIFARNGSGETEVTEENQQVTFVPAQEHGIRVDATDGDESTPRSGVQSIEIRIDGKRVFHDTQACDTHSCPMERTYTVPTGDYGIGEHAVQVITTDYAASDDPLTSTPPENKGVRYRRAVRNFSFLNLLGAQPGSADGSKLGLEDYFHYDPTPTGAGGALQSNLANGNLVWHKVPIVDAGRGLSTFVNTTYNSQERRPNALELAALTPMSSGYHDDLGAGFSSAISGLTRINEPLGGAYLPVAPTVTLADPDGTRHLFRLRGDGSSYEPPPGVNLELRRYQNSVGLPEDNPFAWAITRPDGATYFFDGWGYARSIMDRNGNEIRFEYEKVDPNNGEPCLVPDGPILPLVCEPRLVRVIDPAGTDAGASQELKDARTLTIQYHPGAPNSTTGAGKISRILDHGPRATDFFYDPNGHLVQMAEARGADVRFTNFTYTGGTLSAVSDGLNQQTRIGYAGPAGSPVSEIIDRRLNRKTYAYGLAPPSGSALSSQVTDARHHSSRFDFDIEQRPLRITDPRGTKTELEWDSDSNVSRIRRAAGTPEAAETTMGYDQNGMLVFQRDPLGRFTFLDYRRSAGTMRSATGVDGDGQFVSDLNLMRRPAGNTWTFELDGGASDPADLKGNVTAQIDPLGGRAETTYGPHGEILSERDQVGNLTTYPLADYDPNGMPQVKIDPRGNAGDPGTSGRWVYGYDARGNLTKVTDPRGSVPGGPGAQPHNWSTHIVYDNLDRPLGEFTPRDPVDQPGAFVGHTRYWDRNDNVVRVRDGFGRDLHMTYSPTDQGLTQQNANGEITRHEYDAVGNLIEIRLPRGNLTRYTVDEIGRTVVEQRLGIDDPDLLTSYAYDRRDNLVGLNDPNGNTGGTPASAEANAANPATRRFTYVHDLADRRLFEIENADAAGVFTTEFRYDANDNRTEVTDPRGLASGAERGDFTTRYRYDRRDELVEVEDPFGGVTSYERRADGMVTAETSPNGTATAIDGDHTVDYTYFPTGEIKTRSIPWRDQQYGRSNAYLDGLHVSYQRDPVGNPTQITDARGNSFNNTFLHTGDLKTTARPSWWTLDYSAGPNDLTGEMAGPAGAGTIGMPDAGDRFGATGGGAQPDLQIGLGGPRIVERSGYMREQAQSGAGGEDPSQPASPTDFGRVEPEQLPSMLPDAGSTSFAYDNEMRLTNVTDVAGKVRGHFYDPIGRLTVKGWAFKSNPDSAIAHQYGYDRNGNLTSFTDGSTANWTWGYDEFDRAIQEDAPGATSSPSGDLLAETTKASYDPNGNLNRRITPRGPAFDFLFAYDGADRLTREENPAAEAWSYAYDVAGNRTGETSPRGATQTSSYDALNRMISFTDLAGEETTHEYDANGNPTRVEAPGAGLDPDGGEIRRLTVTEYDGRDLPWMTTTGGADGMTGMPSDGRTTITEYDPNGNLRRTVNPKGVAGGDYETVDDGSASIAAKNATVNVYNSDDLLVARHLPWDADDFEGERRFQQSFERDARGRIFALRAPHQPALPNERVPTTCYTHYETGWTKSASEERRMPAEACGGAGKLFSYDYDARGNQTLWDTAHGQADPNSRRVERSFFPNGTLRQRRAVKTVGGTENAARVYNYYYNANRSLVLFFDQDNFRNTHITRDGAERELAVNEQWGAGRDTLYTYDPSGNVASVRTDGTWTGGTGYSGGKTTSFAYDSAERETSMTVTGGQGPTPRTTTTSYWPSHEVKTRTRTHGGEEGHGFNTHGEISHTDRDPGSNTTYTYDPNGNRLQDERGTYTYNSRDQLTEWDRASDQPNSGGDDRVSYFLGGSGQTKRTEDHGTDETTVFTYTDGSDRLDQTVTTEPGEPTRTTTYDYNAFDSVRTITATAPGEQTTTTTYVYDEFERRIRAKGTLASLETFYCYDGLDRRDARREPDGQQPPNLAKACETGVDRHEYSYVGTTERLSREQRVGGGNLRTYDYDSAGRRQGQVRDGTYRSYRKDANGSVIALEDASGTAIANANYDYDPYGSHACAESVEDSSLGCEFAIGADARGNPFRFQGFYYDSGVKTYDMLARDYRPDVGRFNTADRFESASADLALQSDPLTQNRYAFAGGNPVNNVEFDGHDQCGKHECVNGVAVDKEGRQIGSPEHTAALDRGDPGADIQFTEQGREMEREHRLAVKRQARADLAARAATHPAHNDRQNFYAEERFEEIDESELGARGLYYYNLQLDAAYAEQQANDCDFVCFAKGAAEFTGVPDAFRAGGALLRGDVGDTLKYGGLAFGGKVIRPLKGIKGLFAANKADDLPRIVGGAPTPGEILRPGGRAIGEAGTRPGIRTVASREEMDDLVRQLSTGGVPTRSSYPGTGYDLPGGGFVGIRESRRFGPTVDINIPGIDDISKIHLRR